ncbi:MAG: hypothetical protein LBT09_10835 [Planctomycetaceae bacterium]|jgi:hypothetical protein|nr:hypothetical protein [Planctomycetaceae bacterium]
MSFSQPLITTAFSNYGLIRSLYSYRDSGIAAGGVAGKVNQGLELQKAEPVNDPDAGKIKSASGDILDISDKGRAASELIVKSKVDGSVSDSGNGILSGESEGKVNELSVEDELTAAEKEQVSELEERDAEVRQHEAVHLAVAGQYAKGGAEYTYQTGPDGKKYAIGGSVSIDVSEVEGDPEATIAKMRQVAAAATAPAEPSSQDLKVAAAARQTEAKAKMELAQNKTEAINENNKTNATESKSESDESEPANNSNTKQNIADKILKSVITSAYTSQSTLSSNAKNISNRVNIFA